jgi:hypothetical protein
MKLFPRTELREENKANLEVIREKEAVIAKRINTRLKELAQVEETYTKKKEEKETELAEAEFKLRVFHAKKLADIAVLEERKKQALAPILEETLALTNIKRELKESEEALEEKRREIISAEQHVSSKENELAIREMAFTKLKEETLGFIEREKKESADLIQRSKAEVLSAKEAIKRASVAEGVANERLLLAEEKERESHALLSLINSRLAEERLEQKKTDDKRSMLSSAINLLKKKGLWQLAQEMETK